MISTVSMGVFVDFVLFSGTARVCAVKQMKRGSDERFSDFYRPLREAIASMHQEGLDETVLDDLLSSVADPRERRIFPKVVSGYKAFLRSARVTWFEPPMRDYCVGAVTVRVNPDLGLLVDGKPYAVKLYFRGDAPEPQRVALTNQILADALGSTWPGTTFAMLDVRRARLYPYRPKSELSALLRAESLSLASLWGSL